MKLDTQTYPESTSKGEVKECGSVWWRAHTRDTGHLLFNVDSFVHGNGMIYSMTMLMKVVKVSQYKKAYFYCS